MSETEYKMLRINPATWNKLSKIKKQLTHQEGRLVSFDEVILSLIPRRKR